MPDPTAARPLVTLTVKAYRQEALVGEAVAGALAQTWSPLEVILSDDCSPDGTFRVMQEMAAAYRGPHRVVLSRNPENLGIAGHMNRLAGLVSGRAWVDSAGDDISEPNRVERLAETWIAGGGRTMGVHSGFTEIDADGRAVGTGGPSRQILDQPGPDPLTIVTTGANGVGATALWDMELFRRFGPIPDCCRVQDGVLFFRAALLDGIVYLDEPLIRYRLGGISRRQPRSPGYDYLYGDRLKFDGWRLGNVRAFLADMEKVGDFPGKAAARAFCARYAARAGFEAGLAARGPLGRLAAVPAAAARSLAGRDSFFLRQAVKHALGPVYVAYHNARARTAAG
jgi:glycosyltransferase involved in cell wall biosynthesis